MNWYFLLIAITLIIQEKSLLFVYLLLLYLTIAIILILQCLIAKEQKTGCHVIICRYTHYFLWYIRFQASRYNFCKQKSVIRKRYASCYPYNTIFMSKKAKIDLNIRRKKSFSSVFASVTL